MEIRMKRPFPEEALEHVLPFISSHADRNSASLVCKSWYDLERWSRRHVYIANCVSVSPAILIQRFTNVRSITIKGKHFLADRGFGPKGLGAHALPWVVAVAAAYPALEEIRMKRMVVNDEGLKLIGRKLKKLRCLVLRRCDGFSTDGLAAIAANCRNLRMLDLERHTEDCEVDDLGGNWISSFPDSYTSLEFLNVSSVASELPFSALERLVDRCPNLKTLRVNSSFPLEKLVKLLPKAPQLVDLGIGIFTMEYSPEAAIELARAFLGCKGLKSLSGPWETNPIYLPVLYPLCSGLTFLNLSCSNLDYYDMAKVLRHCSNLQCLWVKDYIQDQGLEEVAASCKELRELNVLCGSLDDLDQSNLTERGLISVAMGCPKLHSVQYFCTQMTNATLFTVAKHMTNLTCLMINIHDPEVPDYLTQQPFDNGYIAILESCKNLKRLFVSGLFTDQLLEHMGTHGKKLTTLLLNWGGTSNLGLNHVLSGCNNLQKLSILNYPFGGLPLVENSDRLENMRFLWMSHARISCIACRLCSG